jgi:hypothetical protein
MTNFRLLPEPIVSPKWKQFPRVEHDDRIQKPLSFALREIRPCCFPHEPCAAEGLKLSLQFFSCFHQRLFRGRPGRSSDRSANPVLARAPVSLARHRFSASWWRPAALAISACHSSASLVTRKSFIWIFPASTASRSSQ